jgi:hypothetical protein
VVLRALSLFQLTALHEVYRSTSFNVKMRRVVIIMNVLLGGTKKGVVEIYYNVYSGIYPEETQPE